MGESSVADFRDGKAFLVNPATLKEAHKGSFYYRYRPMDWMSPYKDWFYSRIGTMIKSSWGNLGLDYSKFSQGKYEVTFVAEDRQGYVTKGKLKLFDHTFTFSYVNQFTNRLWFGVILKAFNKFEKIL